jgi:hypothetical protein
MQSAKFRLKETGILKRKEKQQEMKKLEIHIFIRDIKVL